MLQHLGVVLGDGLRRDARHRGDGRLDLFHADRLLALGLRQKHLRGAGLVDHVDRLVGQLAVVDVARRQFDRRLHRFAGVAQLVELLEIGLEALEDLDRVGDARLLDVDLLEPADQRAVLLEILPVFLVGRRADAAQRALRQRRLQQVRRVHRAARGGAGADDGMNLVDEEDRVLVLLDLLHHLLQALLEVAAIAGAGEQRAHVEREHGRSLEHLGDVGIDDLAREALGDRGLADAGIADQQRIVLLAAAQNLDRALHLRLAADQRIDPPFPRLAVEVDAISVERAFLFLGIAAVLGILRLRAPHAPRRRRAADATDRNGRDAWRCRD